MCSLRIGNRLNVLLLSPRSTALINNNVIHGNILRGSHPVDLMIGDQIGEQGQIRFDIGIFRDQ